MRIETFAHDLKNRIAAGLPGIVAQQRMAPSIRQIKPFEEQEYPLAKKAAVLILLYPHKDAVYTVLMKRPDYVGTHSGQISFPGGKIEADDPDAAYTALRETEEEVGVRKEQVELIGKLSDIYIPPSDFFVYPYIGFTKQRPVFIPDSNEVAEVIETPVHIILDETIKGSEIITRNAVSFTAKYYRIQNYKVWGATAILLSELEMLLADL